MTEKLSSWDPQETEARGIPSAEIHNVYQRWGEGGLGHILTGNIMLAYDQLEAAGNLIIPTDAPFDGPRFEAFTKLATVAKAHGSLITGQVTHPGRQVDRRIQPHPVSASDVHLQGKVSALTSRLRRSTYTELGLTALNCKVPTGTYYPNFIAKHKPPDRCIRVEFQSGGFTVDEARELCRMLEEATFDFVELSGGTYQAMAFKHERESTRKREAFFLEFADMIVPALQKTKTYITGGFKTLSGMLDVLKTVDAVTQEFSLAKDMLNGSISAAINQKVHQDDFALTNTIAGSQIRQVGKGQEPIDMSREENVQTFLEAMRTWAQRMEEDAQAMKLYGYVDLD
ncbi:hypothetical protein POJ06DRAFT_279700 [Lipomyces tetrasporus]|uniref:NADH:flavin oxidoreductase/NADH oxidase N-terminal domain-containing protein n=1 Tax=Lipomyces tetrasporus TaxID=54092 RepID=A0AAD7QZT5_9ASCO|nr:uncharacterized protein POJ06DRAFT_279700 [Lipomyces tetrasporus]KAJ8104208.1 hypothetical protein POJ06DRAFT_279700 [Lipomyces tetrasporus]